MQLSGAVGLPLLLKTGWYDKYTGDTRLQIASGHWAIISFFAAFLVVLLLLRKDENTFERNKTGMGVTIIWMIAGVFLAFFAQAIAANIEMLLFDIKPGSENTERLIEIATLTPLFILVTSILGPILEEIVFRKILFGTLYKRFNFFIAAIISSLIFAAVHFDFTHLLIYTLMGLVFSFLYVQTRRIIVPIAAHTIMNTVVVLINAVFRDDLERMMRHAEKLQAIIGGF
jgi:membrane protease YdiL (CAAX protease family)